MKAALLLTSGLFLLAAFAGQPSTPQTVANLEPVPAVDHSAELAKLQAQLDKIGLELTAAKNDLAAANARHAQQIADLNAKLAAASQQPADKGPPQPSTKPQAVAYGGSCAGGSCGLGSRYASGGKRPGLFPRLRALRGR